jgi:adenosylcobinamide-phosphate synthase
MLATAVVLDVCVGDPRYAYHPVRLMGKTLVSLERLLKRRRWTGYGGGGILFVALFVVWVVAPSLLLVTAASRQPRFAAAAHAGVVFSLLALRDLLDHVRSVQSAARQNKPLQARAAIARMVARDTEQLDLAGCRRAAVESLAENFVDGFVSPVFWYVLLGIPGLLLFKVVSTMDSMVGYKTPEYLRFGWCGARLDDLMNYLPARLAWLLLSSCGLFFRELSPVKALRIGIAQHAVLPGPNPGWSEATMAGLLQRRLIGCIRKNGAVVADVWIGDPADPEAGGDEDVTRGLRVIAVAALVTTVIGLLVLLR